MGCPGGSDGKESACNAGDPGVEPGSEDPLKKELATHSSILAWRIPWTEEEPDGPQSMGPQSRIRQSNQHTSVCLLYICMASLVAQRVKRLPAMLETRVQSLGQEDPLQKEMATHSSILAWKIPWTEEPGGLQTTVSQRVGHD